MKVFSFREYRDFIRSKIEENRGTRGYQALLAKAAGCQRSFLSQVLNSHVQLTPDQAANLARYWALEEDETEYFLALVNLARASSPHLKALLGRKLAELRRRQEDLAHRMRGAETLTGEPEIAYYSAWYMSAIHVLLAIPGYNDARAIASRLGLAVPLAESALATLEKLGLARKGADGWSVTRHHVHLPRHSPLVGVHHSNWRQIAILKMQARDPADLHFTGIHSLSARDVQRIKELLLDALERASKIIAPSPEEELICLNCDLFRV